ncbi:MAG: hypothetical protein PUC82_03530 [bacterium]|nr:hypothetical protein [bacterium]
MDNPEFIELRNRFLFGLFIAIIVVICGILLFSKKFGDGNSSTLKAIYNNKTFLLFIVDSKNCTDCLEYKKLLDSSDVDYIEYNIYKAKDLEEVCFRLQIKQDNLKAPSLIYIEDGKKVGSVLGISSALEMNGFLENYKFIEG